MRVAVVLATCLVALTSAVGCTPGQEEGQDGFVFTDDELDTHERINDYRDSQGLPPLEADPVLGELAREHSDNMLAGIVPFSHDGFEGRAQAIIDSGASSAAENVAYNGGFSDPVGTAVDGWIASPGHQENMVGDFSDGGIGIATDGETFYFTQLFAARD
jgi:uncharacterized protein YkwD